MIVQALVIVLLIYCVLLRWKARHRIAFSKHFKSELKTIPILGHAYLLPRCKTDRGRWELLKMFGNEALKQGGAVCSWNGPILYFIVANPAISEPIMKSCLEKDDAMKLSLTLIGNGSVVADVPIWRPRRKVLVPTFSLKYLVQFEEIFSKHSVTMVNQLRKFAGQRAIPIAEHVITYAMDSVCETALGIEAHAQENPEMKVLDAFKNSFRLLADRIMKPWLHINAIYKLTTHHTELMGYMNTIESFILKVISEKRQELTLKCNNNDNTTKEANTRKSFLDLMIESSDYSDNTLKEEIAVLFVAGTDTSAVAISFTSMLLARHPSVQEKVYQELKEVFGDSKRPVLYDDLNHLKYLEAVIKESLRLYPPAPVLLRKVESDVILPSGITLPKDTGVMINVYCTHRNTEYWGKDAEEFRPERFIDTPLKHPSAFMAFSTGPRNCVGYRYAMMSMKTALATLLRHYRILPTSEEHIGKPIDVKFDIMLRATDGFQVILEPRP